MPIIHQNLVSLQGEAVPRDVDTATLASLLQGTQRWRAPVNGTVYGTLLNYHGALAALGDAVQQPSYKAAPKAPVLYIKPRNTLAAHGAAITVPHGLSEGIAELEMGASLGIVIGRTACRLRTEEALAYVAGYVIVNDVSIPHDSYYRPSIRLKARDGFCPVGPAIVARALAGNADALGIRVWIDGELRQQNSTANMIRSISQLLADVTDFMTLSPGDVLMTGVPEAAPRARAGQHVAIEIDGIGRLENTLIAEAE